MTSSQIRIISFVVLLLFVSLSPTNGFSWFARNSNRNQQPRTTCTTTTPTSVPVILPPVAHLQSWIATYITTAGANATSLPAFNCTKNPYKAPGPGDSRGPCPGTNTFANHGCVNPSGNTDIAELMNVQINIASFDSVIAAIIAFFELPFAGNVFTATININTSIPCYNTQYLSIFDGPGFSIHKGIEIDASFSRGDYFYKDNFSRNKTLIAQLKAFAKNSTTGIDKDFVGFIRQLRCQQSRASNPTYYFSPVQFILAAIADTAGLHTFRCPNVAPTMDTYFSFFENETIPHCFGKQNTSMTFTECLANAIYIYEKYPVLLSQIGNFSVMPFPRTVPCAQCYFRLALAQEIPLVDTYAFRFIKANLFDLGYIVCDPVTQMMCGYGNVQTGGWL